MKTLALLVLMLILLVPETLAQRGAIMFSQHGAPGVGEAPYGVVAGDFDGDGDLDLASANRNSNEVTILQNDGAGNFSTLATVGGLNLPESITVADFDGDGDLDLAITEYSANRVALLENDGSGAFTLATTIDTEQRPHFVTIGDFDGDGDLDLAIANDGSNSVTILENESTPVAIETDEAGVPRAFRLEQNYPNPFNPSTTIPYRLSNAAPVTLQVYDVLGRDVATLVDAFQAPGRYEVTFDADGLPGGVYLYRLQTDARVLSRAMLLFN